MKYVIAAAALVMMGLGANAMAEDGHVSQAQLADLGVPGISVMSDAQGSEVRGQGFAFAASVSASGVPGAFNVSPAAALGFNNAAAVSGSASQIEVQGFFGGIGGGGGFFGVFGIQANVASSGYAFASAN